LEKFSGTTFVAYRLTVSPENNRVGTHPLNFPSVAAPLNKASEPLAYPDIGKAVPQRRRLVSVFACRLLQLCKARFDYLKLPLDKVREIGRIERVAVFALQCVLKSLPMFAEFFELHAIKLTYPSTISLTASDIT
jgi:hypothetical protein